jgi:WXXGXW repeat (2 copies)
MRKTLLALFLVGSAFTLSAQIGIGIRIGPPPPPRVVAVRPASPGAGYLWVEGYQYPVNGHYRWHEGYWSRPPYEGAHWVGPRHDGQQFFAGYWDGDHGRIEHDHHSDHGRDRDFRR